VIKNGESSQREGPPWGYIDPADLLRELLAQIASQAEEMAAMRIYIGKLHEALATATATMEDNGVKISEGAVGPAT